MSNHELLDSEGYPTQHALETIEKWDYMDPYGLIDFLEPIWWAPDWGIKKSDGVDICNRPVLKFELHTGGWSGNEDIVRSLIKNYFWGFYWQMSKRGGHYYFEIPTKERLYGAQKENKELQTFQAKQGENQADGSSAEG